MQPPAPVPPGLMDRISSIGDHLVALLQGRLALVATELQEEKFRLIQIFIWFSVALFTGLLAIIFASLTLVVWYWDTARLAVLVGLTIFYTGAWLVLVLAFRRFLARQPPPFAASLEEIAKDRSCFQAGN